jgi:hypothetical protein
MVELVLFYDLKKDEHEMENLYKDPAYQKLVQTKGKLKYLKEEYKDTEPVTLD